MGLFQPVSYKPTPDRGRKAALSKLNATPSRGLPPPPPPGGIAVLENSTKLARNTTPETPSIGSCNPCNRAVRCLYERRLCLGIM